MHKPAAMDGPPIVQRLLQSIEDEARMRCAASTPSDDAAGEAVDNKRYINKALPSGYVGEILSANSGGLCQGGEACHARLGTRRSGQPVRNA
jgi:hypothetical protein